jgi:uncharacterized membrane protein YedE/YeeE
MQIVFALICGLIFGIGLIVSGMANPAKVQNFLDVFGNWDPSLAFVMGGAIAVTLPAFIAMPRLGKPFFADAFQFPTRSDLDAKLLAGAAVFGVGWGLGGFCPGPAVTGVSFGQSATLLFVVAMLVGMMLAKVVQRSGT